MLDIYDANGSGSWSTGLLSTARTDLAAAATGDVALFGGGT